MIDISKPVRFYDDRSKCKDLVIMRQVLYSDDEVCLCKVDTDEKVMFSLKDRAVLTDNYMFWYAENY